MMDQQGIGVLGATSLVGRVLLPRLIGKGCKVTAFTREIIQTPDVGVQWRQLGVAVSSPQFRTRREVEHLPLWISVAPIWVLQDNLRLLEAYGVRRLVALSSTSRFTKVHSPNLEEQKTAHRLIDAEKALRIWAQRHDVEWVILRPTLIYGLGRDKNITEIVKFIRRFGFFPIFARAEGLRQPIHAADVAEVCVTALFSPEVSNSSYNISGRDTVSYREMVTRVFNALGKSPRMVPVPFWLLRLALVFLQKLPHYRHWNTAMVTRMGSDMSFEHSEAARDLAFKPRNFILTADDMPE